MRINEAATQSGVSASTIRYYEQQGLLHSVKRTPAGYRSFDAKDVALLKFLRKARDLGFTVSECRELLNLVATPALSSQENISRAHALATRRRAEISEQIVELQRLPKLIQLHIDSLAAAESFSEDCPVTRDLGLPRKRRNTGQ